MWIQLEGKLIQTRHHLIQPSNPVFLKLRSIFFFSLKNIIGNLMLIIRNMIFFYG